MEIDKTAFEEELKKIVKEGRKDVFYNIVAKLHVKSKDKDGKEETKEFEALKVIELTSRKNYSQAYYDKIKIIILLNGGLYTKYVFPNIKNVELTVIMKPQTESSSAYDKEKEILTQRFKAIPNMDTLINTPGTSMDAAHIETLDLSDSVRVEFELMDKTIWNLRPVTFGTILRKIKPIDAIRAILIQQSKVEGLEKEDALLGVDLVEPDNKEKREHFIIPHGTLLTSAALYIQNECGGVYNTHIGQYLHQRFWFVYPLFNTRRAKDCERVLNLYKIPGTEYKNTERTFRTEEKKHYLLGTLSSSLKDNLDTDFLNQGNGIRFTDSRLIMQDGLIVEKNKLKIKREELNYEIIFKKQENDDGDKKEIVSNIFMDERARIHSNPFVVNSSMTAKYGMFYEFDWQNADPSILVPGMCVKVHYLEKKNVVTLEGCLHYAFVYYHNRGMGLISSSYNCYVKLGVYVNKPIDEKEQGTSEDVAKNVDKWAKYESP